MTTITPRSRGTRYPVNVSEFARRLHANDRTIAEIIEALARQGYYPTRSTVLYWCDAEAREIHNFSVKLARYPHGRRRQRDTIWWAKLRRMRELRTLGVSFDSIRRIVNHDLGLELNTEQVRSILQERVSQRTVKRLLSARADGEVAA